MSGQLTLAGFDAPQEPTDRLFFAILPDADALARIERLVRDLRGSHSLKGRSLGSERFHITLHHVGDFAGLPSNIVDAACKSAEAVAAATAPFKLGFDRVASFPRKAGAKPLVLLGGDGLFQLTAFQQVLSRALSRARLGHNMGTHYTPHLTLLYDDHPIAEQAIGPIAWTAREFVLVRSLIGQGRHEVLARLPFSG